LSSSEITLDQINTFVAAWYEALDFHLPIETVYPLLADEGLNVQFPDGDIKDHASFNVWYDRVTNLFFDENHNVVSVDADIVGDSAMLDAVVAWQASWWIPPAAKSKRTSMNATQRWKVRKSSKNSYGLEIVEYNAIILSNMHLVLLGFRCFLDQIVCCRMGTAHQSENYFLTVASANNRERPVVLLRAA
jgi:hypothetical protein